MTKIHEAREALGQRLRELRRETAMNGKELAEALGWPASKADLESLGLDCLDPQWIGTCSERGGHVWRNVAIHSLASTAPAVSASTTVRVWRTPLGEALQQARHLIGNDTRVIAELVKSGWDQR
ncbi:hypothetical protein ABZ070_27310 [Streptomyces sp. NPDC006283]|uniref:hypothetical protein n=1 Tax=Streptomyces sp. NPDC006283 TaxID=3156741 RepID=UPI0033B29FB3